MEKRNELIIIPVVLEDCDWLNTPFKEFKALPKDGKAISLWENKNTAFLDVIQNIRNLVTIKADNSYIQPNPKEAASPSRNYKVQKDFDSIEKMEFIEESFSKIKDILTKYINEIIHIDKIKARILLDTKEEFHCMIVNRNKIDVESTLKFFVVKEKQQNFNPLKNEELSYEIENLKRAHSEKNFSLAFDDYHLFWLENNGYGLRQDKNEWNYRNMADKIWNELLENVGIF